MWEDGGLTGDVGGDSQGGVSEKHLQPPPQSYVLARMLEPVLMRTGWTKQGDDWGLAVPWDSQSAVRGDLCDLTG